MHSSVTLLLLLSENWSSWKLNTSTIAAWWVHRSGREVMIPSTLSWDRVRFKLHLPPVPAISLPVALTSPLSLALSPAILWGGFRAWEIILRARTAADMGPLQSYHWEDRRTMKAFSWLTGKRTYLAMPQTKNWEITINSKPFSWEFAANIFEIMKDEEFDCLTFFGSLSGGMVRYVRSPVSREMACNVCWSY